MYARKEEALEVERKLEEKIKQQPEILGLYYNSIMTKSYTTKQNYIGKIILYFDFLKEKKGLSVLSDSMIKSTGIDDINDYVIYLTKEKSPDKDYSRAYLANTMCALSSFYGFMVRRKYIEENPVELAENKPRLSSWDGDVVYLTDREKEILFDNVRKRNSKFVARDVLLMLLPLVTGIRVSALVHINVADIDFTEQSINIYDKGVDRKGKSEKIYLTGETMEYLRKWMKIRATMIPDGVEIEPLFFSIYGGECKRLTPTAVRKIVAKNAKGIDKHITPHKLRSTFGTDYYNSCHDIYETASAMGHRNVQTTKHYAAVDMKRKAEHMSALTQNTLKAVMNK